MAAARIDQLTEAQRACLRLVLTHHNSKEIAAIVGVSPSAIDKRIERAIQILGVGSRFEAARRLQEQEGSPAYERLPCEPIDVPIPPSAPPQDATTEPSGLVRRFIGTSPDGGFEGVARNRLSKSSRMVRVVGLMVMIAIASMAIVNMALTLSSLLKPSPAVVPPLRGVALATPTGGRLSMLNERRRATDTVTVDFLKAEAAVDEAAQLAASCVSTLLQQRLAATLPLGTGSAAIQLVADASMDMMKARQRFVDAHRALVEVRHDIGLGRFYGYGDVSDCPPAGALGVEVPRLSAVA